MVVKVGINGFGRIGRQVFKTIFGGYGPDDDNPEGLLQIVAVNDLMDLHTIAHLYKYDSTYGIADEEIEVSDHDLIVDGNAVHVFSERDPPTSRGAITAWISSLNPPASSPTPRRRRRI
jgi:glyceraldehyde 3-phosphate dehydrogenase